MARPAFAEAWTGSPTALNDVGVTGSAASGPHGATFAATAGLARGRSCLASCRLWRLLGRNGLASSSVYHSGTEGKVGTFNNLARSGALADCFEAHPERENADLNRLPSLALFAILFTGPASFALPANSTAIVQPAFGNTIVSSYADGRHAELWLNPDGSYTARGRRHEPSDGHWKVRGGLLCLRQSHPATFPISYCTPIPADLSSNHWSGKAFTGENIQISLRPGRADPPA
jgi:hypothetical protein